MAGMILLMTALAGGCSPSEENQDVIAEEEITTVEETDEPESTEAVEEDTLPDPLDTDAMLTYFEDHDYTITWPVLWVVVPNIDADGNMDGNPVHGTVQMPEEEQDYFLNEVSAEFERTVEEFTEGRIDIELTTLLYADPVTYLDEVDNSLIPESFHEETLEQFAAYNSIICTARFSEPDTPIFSQDWFGLAMGALQGSGYGFCQVASNGDYDDTVFKATDLNPYEAEPWIHEWIHTLEPFGEGFGRIIPSPDGADSYGYESTNPEGINGFYQYYYDILNNAVWDENQGDYAGISEPVWKSVAYIYDCIRSQEG